MGGQISATRTPAAGGLGLLVDGPIGEPVRSAGGDFAAVTLNSGPIGWGHGMAPGGAVQIRHSRLNGGNGDPDSIINLNAASAALFTLMNGSPRV